MPRINLRINISDLNCIEYLISNYIYFPILITWKHAYFLHDFELTFGTFIIITLKLITKSEFP